MYKRPIRSDELYHVWGLKRGSMMDDHKYIARVEDGINKYGLPRYRYFYTREEYNAYRLGKQQAKEPIKQEAVAQKTVFQTEYKPSLASLTSTNQNKEGIGDAIDKFRIEKNYKIDKHKVDPAADKYDNRFTTKEAFDNMRQSGLYDYVKEASIQQDPSTAVHFESDEAFEKYLRSDLDASNSSDKESIADILQRNGYIDETQPGMHPESFDDLKKLDKDVDDDIDMYCINHDNLYANVEDGDLDTDDDGEPDTFCNDAYLTNCAYCTLAYDLRQRGYDVEASAAYYETANDDEEIETWYEGGKFTQFSSTDVDEMEKEILAHSPEGSYGQFGCFWVLGGGHAMVYEVKNGEVWIRDCQHNEKYKLKEYPLRGYFSSNPPPDYMRTDNLKLTDRALVGVKNR